MIAPGFIFTNGNVFTAESNAPFGSAVAVAGESIVAVGTSEEIALLRGPHTEVIDLEGRLLTPGFTDAHVHVATSGLDQSRVSFDNCEDADDAIAAIGRYAAALNDGAWITGSGWSQSWFEKGCPDARLLDAVSEGRPAFISNRDGHGAWVNSMALELAGVDSATTDPGDGRIERRSDGTPQGTLHEGAMYLVEKHAPADTAEDLARGLQRGQEEMLRFGITGWQEASVRPEVQEAYLAVATAGHLLGDVVGALWWERHRGMDQIDELIERRENSAPGFRPTSVKLMLDGVAENYTASVLDPYLDDKGEPTDNTGVDFIDPEQLKYIVTRLDAEGFQCHFHALGDKAVRSGLDSIEAALRVNGRRDHRHNLAHLQFVHPDDIQRFAALDAIANAQPLWACNDDYQIKLTQPFVTSERHGGQYPFASLLRSGARLGMGSDWNVSTANVMEEIDVAIRRTCVENSTPLGIDEALTPVEALTAFTMGSAYINHSESRRGSIAVGKQADLVIFDRDPLSEGYCRETEVELTIVAGQIVYRRDGSDVA